MSMRLIACLIWMSGLAYFSLSTHVKAPVGLQIWDKFSHFSAYAVLALLVIRTLTVRYRPSVRILSVGWVICSAYGLFLEMLQGAMGFGRLWELGDLLANALGALVVCVLFRLCSPR